MLTTAIAASFLFAQALSVFSVFTVSLFMITRLVANRRATRAISGHGYGVLITGCDSGFGHHLALRLDATGFVVFAGCLAPGGDGARTLRKNASEKLRIVKLDVTSDEEVEEAKEFIQKNLPEKGLWAVVNNAGISDWSETEWSTIRDYQSMVDINLFGGIRTSLALLPFVRASKGRMVFVSSILAFFNCPNMGSYSVSKRGLEAFADCLRVEMASFGVKVSIVQPGNFGQATSIVRSKTTADIWDKLDDERKKMFNREYIDLAVEYFMSMCRSGFKDPTLVVDSMVDAITSSRPKRRYLLVSKLDSFFFYTFPYLPSFLTDAVFSLSPMYGKRQAMLYS